MKNITTRRLLATVAVLAATAGCGAAHHGTAKRDASAAATSTVPSGPTGDLKNPHGAISALAKFSCAPDKSQKWSARALIANPTAAPSRYLVTVSVVKRATSEVQDTRSTTVTVPGHGKQAVAFAGLHGGPQSGRACVPRVVSGH
jgi:hypothetical protein